MVAHPPIAGRYVLGSLLGRGGMGSVWSAFDERLQRDVAVKTIDLGADAEPVARKRFEREALATASLSHDHVVTVFDAGVDTSTAYLVMELLPGPTLGALIAAQGPLPEAQAIDLACQAAAGLAAAHAVGVVHRDVKPGNLMLGSDRRLKVVDFGIARLTQTTSTQLTATDTTPGSAAYMSPEQARAENATEATDVYALGCVITTMLTGRPPFVAEHPVAVLNQHLTTPAPLVSDLRPDVDPALVALVDQMLAKDAADRPSGMGEVLARLLSLRRPENGSPTTPMPVPTGSASEPTALLTTPLTQAGRTPSRRTLAMLVLAAVAVLTAVLLLVVPDWSDDNGARNNAGRTPSGASSEPAGSDLSSPPPAPSDPSVSDAVAALGTVVDSLAANGQADTKTQDQLAHGVEKLEKVLEKGDLSKLDHEVEGLQHTLEHAVDKGEITQEGRDLVESALALVTESAG